MLRTHGGYPSVHRFGVPTTRPLCWRRSVKKGGFALAFWGVDSCTPITSSYLADVKTWGGTTPTFWGRHLTNNSVCPNGQLSGPEITIRKDNNIGIIPVVNSWNLSDVSTKSDGDNVANHFISVLLDNGNGVGVPMPEDLPCFFGFDYTMVGSEYAGRILLEPICGPPGMMTGKSRSW